MGETIAQLDIICLQLKPTLLSGYVLLSHWIQKGHTNSPNTHRLLQSYWLVSITWIKIQVIQTLIAKDTTYLFSRFIKKKSGCAQLKLENIDEHSWS